MKQWYTLYVSLYFMEILLLYILYYLSFYKPITCIGTSSSREQIIVAIYFAYEMYKAHMDE